MLQGMDLYESEYFNILKVNITEDTLAYLPHEDFILTGKVGKLDYSLIYPITVERL